MKNLYFTLASIVALLFSVSASWAQSSSGFDTGFLNGNSTAASSSASTVTNPVFGGNGTMYLQGDTLYSSNGTVTTISNPSQYYLAGTNEPVTSAPGYSATTVYQVTTTPGQPITTAPGAPFYNSGGSSGTTGNTTLPTSTGTLNPGPYIPTVTSNQSTNTLRTASQRCLAPVFGGTNYFAQMFGLGVASTPYYPQGGSVNSNYTPQAGIITFP